MNNKISWTDQTWNPVTGCSKISPGCRNCYAERMSKRLAGRAGYPPTPDNFKITLHPDKLEQPLHWRKPRRVFVCSMGDLFHDDVPFEFIARVWAKMYQAKNHTFQVLTKRPQRMLGFLSGVGYWEGWWTHNGAPPEKAYRGNGIVLGGGKFSWPLSNVWLGVTAENQKAADERRAAFEQVPAAVKFVSYEPALGPVDWSGWEFVNQIIAGGETGPGARPAHPDWFRSTRDWCVENGVAFHFKQWGEWIKQEAVPHHWTYVGFMNEHGDKLEPSSGNEFWRVGKNRAGHLLDGVEWRQMPEV